MKLALLFATVLLVALIVWWVAPLVVSPELTTLAEEAALREMLALASAESPTVIAVPSFAPAWRELDSVLGSLLDESARNGLDAAAWIVGGAPLVAWEGAEWGAVARPDPLRRTLIRIVSGLAGGDVRVNGKDVILGSAPAARAGSFPPTFPDDPGHLFLLHRPGAPYPPTPRPAWSAVRLDGDRLRIATVASSDRPRAVIRLDGATLPADALLAARFAEAPEAVEAIDDIFPIGIGRFLGGGGLVALYGVERGGLIPVPRLVFGVPADDARAAEIVDLIDRATARGAARLLLGDLPDDTRIVAGTTVTRRRGIGMTIEFARREGEFLIAFDDETLARLLEDERVAAGEGEAAWVLRARVRELLPALETLGYSPGVRLLADDFAAEARELAETLRTVPQAQELRATLRPRGGSLRLDAELQLAK